jgi:ribosomal protein S20
MAEKKPKGPQKRPSALKRDMQAETRRLRNRSRKAEIFTERKKLEAAPAEKKSPAEFVEDAITIMTKQGLAAA